MSVEIMDAFINFKIFTEIITKKVNLHLVFVMYVNTLILLKFV